MIATASLTSQQRRAAHQGGILALVPPRHSKLPVCILYPGKHFIGTDEGCQVRVEAEGVQSRHALIIVGDQKVLLKAIDPRTWVNDHSVTETVLRAGERVSVGPITFAVRFALPEELRTAPVQPVPDKPRYEQIELPAEIQLPPIPAEAKTENPLPANLTVLKAGFPIVGPSEKISVPSNVETPLRTIEKELEEFVPLATNLIETPISARVTTEEQRLIARENQLNHLADELTSQSKQLNVRSQQLASLEADLEQKQSQIAQDNDRLIKAVQEAQQRLADESARQTSLWQEWDASYQRSRTEINSQFETLETQREAVRSENQRLDQKREEVQRIQSEFETLQRDLASEKVQIAENVAKLQARSSAFETERRQHFADLEEQETKIANQRRDLLIAENELQAARQQIESIRSSFESEESERRAINSQEEASHRARFEDAESSLNALKDDLESQKVDFDHERNLLAQERFEFETERAEFHAQLLDFENRRFESDQASTIVQQAPLDTGAIEIVDHDGQLRLEQWEKELEAQRLELETARNNLRLEQHALEATRAKLATSTIGPALDLPSPITSGSASSVQKYDDWLPISDKAEELIDSFGPSSALSSDADDIASSRRVGATFDLGVAAVPTPVLFSHGMTLPESSVGSYEPPRPDFEDAYQLVQPIESEKFTSRLHADTFPTVESRSEFHPAVEADNSASYQEKWGSLEPKSADSTITTATELSLPEVDETLSDVNSRFGILVSGSDETRDPSVNRNQRARQVERHLQSESNLSDSGYEANHQVVNADNPSMAAGDAEDPLLSLRTKLAQMFELGTDRNARTNIETNYPAEETTGAMDSADQSSLEFDSPVGIEALSMESPEQCEDQPSSPTEAMASESLQASFGRASTSASTSQHSANAGDTTSEEEEDAWSRRLRELAAVAEGSQPTPPPVPKAEAASVAKEQPKSTEEDEEFSVEAQLARLLGRPMNKSSEAISAAQPTSPAELAQEEDDPATSFELDARVDRSHLISEPRHKQDKNAVREEVQSFRAVAQMSARKALEKHSWNNFKSEFYFSFILLLISLAASAWFVGAFCYGIESNPWKAITCIIASILCGMKLTRLFSRLTRTQGKKSKGQSPK